MHCARVLRHSLAQPQTRVRAYLFARIHLTRAREVRQQLAAPAHSSHRREQNSGSAYGSDQRLQSERGAIRPYCTCHQQSGARDRVRQLCAVL